LAISDRLYLPVAELHRGGPVEYRDDYLDGALLRVHFVHDAVVVLEGPFLDLDRVPLGELDLELRLLGVLLRESPG
jgi:hypothetical protein